MVQLKFFGHALVKSAYLLAIDSRRQAFYTLWIESGNGAFRVCKESGGMGKVWQRQVWPCSSLAEAEKLFTAKLKEKTSPNRRSARKYRIVHRLC